MKVAAPSLDNVMRLLDETGQSPNLPVFGVQGCIIKVIPSEFDNILRTPLHRRTQQFEWALKFFLGCSCKRSTGQSWWRGSAAADFYYIHLH